MNESGRIAMLARILAARAPGLETGIGDDAAVLATRAAGARLVWTIDEQVEGSHFRRDLASWHDLGWRSLMAAASDIAAMGAIPWCALAAMVLPDDADDAALEQIAFGQRDAGAVIDAPVVGGNLAHGATLSISTTVLGTCERAITRSGAVPGDRLWLAGDVGLAAAGFRALIEGRGDDERLWRAVAAWRKPRALIAAGRAMAAVAHAAVDVSDGLARDAGHIAEASGVEVVLDEAALGSDPVLVGAAAALGASWLELALSGGEDYAIVATSPTEIAGFRCIGAIRPGHGLTLHGPAGERRIEPSGFDHFA